MAKIIVLDTETTGLDPETDRLVELATIGVDVRSERFSSLVDPMRDIPATAKAVHHITEAMVKGAPAIWDVFHRMIEVHSLPEIVVAHNAKFDKGFVDHYFSGYGPPPRWICTYKCAYALLPGMPGYSNQVLRYHLNLMPDLPPDLAPHRALYDIIVTREIFTYLFTLASIEEMIEISDRPLLLREVTFGKHKGKTWDQVDRGYLSWCLREADMSEDVKFTARHYLERR